MPSYKRPPITEAVIEARFEDVVSGESVEKARVRFSKDYANSQPLTALGLNLNVEQKKATVDETSQGFRLSNLDQTDILVVSPERIVFSRLAPYLGWDAFREHAGKNWRIWKRIAGYNKIERLGVRYINRIDIPSNDDGIIPVEEYLTVYPNMPDPPELPHMGRYMFQMEAMLGKDDCRLLIQSGIIPSPLVNFTSVVLDIDVSRVNEVPQKDTELWALIDRIRDYKNDTFEACITDRARALFDK